MQAQGSASRKCTSSCKVGRCSLPAWCGFRHALKRALQQNQSPQLQQHPLPPHYDLHTAGPLHMPDPETHTSCALAAPHSFRSACLRTTPRQRLDAPHEQPLKSTPTWSPSLLPHSAPPSSSARPHVRCDALNFGQYGDCPGTKHGPKGPRTPATGGSRSAKGGNGRLQLQLLCRPGDYASGATRTCSFAPATAAQAADRTQPASAPGPPAPTRIQRTHAQHPNAAARASVCALAGQDGTPQ
jgi:hypothetical protein